MNGFLAVYAIAGVVVLEMIRRKDFYVLFILTALISLILAAMNFFNETGIVRYLKEMSLLLIWISSFIIAIMTTARQIPSERENRTIYPLLAKPVSRWELLLGKYLGCLVATLLAVAVFYLFFTVITAAREQQIHFLSYLQAMVLHGCLLSILIAFTLFGSLVFAAPSSNTTITLVLSLGILFLGRYLHLVAVQTEQPVQTILTVAYYVIPHLEFFDMRKLVIHNYDPIAWSAFLLAILYATAYSALFLAASYYAFRKRPLN